MTFEDLVVHEAHAVKNLGDEKMCLRTNILVHGVMSQRPKSPEKYG